MKGALSVESRTDQYIGKLKKMIRAICFIGLSGAAALLLFIAALLIYARLLGPPPLAVPQSSVFYSDDGQVIGESNNGQKRYWVPLDQMSPELIEAVLAVEDRDFYEHHGFDFKRIAGAVVADVKALSKVQGASTITQQYARNLFLTHEKTWYRKLNEALYTLRIEMNYSKDEILEGYLNTIYFGHGAYGAEAASQYYFGKAPSELNTAEASLMAGVPKGPSYYSPIQSFEHAKKRQNVVLLSMEQAGYITSEERKNIHRQEISLNGQHEEPPLMAPYYLEAVKQEVSKLKLKDSDLHMGGLKIYTSLDTDIQKAGETAFALTFPEASDMEGALVAMEPRSGEVKALIGGRDFDKSKFNRATQAVRQPGSTIKPILYYSALEHGFTPATMLKSESTSFTFKDSDHPYKPSNFNSQYADKEITMLQAIALSDNIYAVKTHLFLGEKNLIETARKFGIESEVKALPSAALGTSGVKVIEMVNAYSRLASGGKAVDPVFIKKIENHKGEVIYKSPAEFDMELDSDYAFIMSNMLKGVFNEKLNGHSTVTGASIAPRLTREYSGKSGSTKTDSWMIGYTPGLVAGVWTGYDHGKLIEGKNEKQYAKQIWADFMEDSLKDDPVQSFEAASSDIVAIKIDPETGQIAGSNCSAGVLTYFTKGSEPTETCGLHPADEKGDKEGAPAHKNEQDRRPWYKKWNPFR
ncbi:MAG: transglycosylase domain-containing protein [Bacillus sp. (in: firmicutes)]